MTSKPSRLAPSSSPRRHGPRSTAYPCSTTRTVLTPARVAMLKVEPNARPSRRRYSAKTRVPLPHISASEPSALSPACRSAMRCTWAGVRSSEPSRSGTRTKSFSVPWPLVKRVMSVILRYAVAHPRIRLTNCREGPVEQVRARGVEPLDAGVGPEPRLLPAGVAASRLSRVAARRGLVEGAVDDGDGLAVADGPTRGDTVAQTHGEEGLGLATQPRLPHALDTPLDAFHEDVTVDAEA